MGGTIPVVEKIPVVHLSGEYDIYTADKLAEALRPIEGRGIVDLSGVRYLDSSGLAQLAKVANRCGVRRVVLIVPDRGIRRILAISQFEKLFVVVERLEDARVSLLS